MALWRGAYQQILLNVILILILVLSTIHRRSLLYNENYPTFLDQLDITCDGLLDGNPREVELLKNWKITEKMRATLEKQIAFHSTHCETYQEMLGFPKEPLSHEEAEFPMAYGMLVYQDFLQVLLMLSGFYHPQNEYCIAVSGQADGVFRGIMESLQKCFPNIHILDRPAVVWGGHEIMNSTYACFEYLVKAGKPWRYFQYLSGVDLPLKTNLEMVKILKTWNGATNMDVVPFESWRLMGKKLEDAPLPLYKSSVSVIIPREMADELVQSEMTMDLLDFLNGTGHSDETFWATLIGNKKKFPIPGAFEASEMLDFRQDYYNKNKERVERYRDRFSKHDTVKLGYYVTRMHVWDTFPHACKGKFYRFSCIFGAEDLPVLLKQPHFVAHKFYMDYEPAGLICGLKNIRQRTLRRKTKLDTTPYEELPLVEIHNGTPLKKIKHPLWLLGETFRELSVST